MAIRLVTNGDFSAWATEPVTPPLVVNAGGAPPYSMPDGWYGGPGPGGQYYVYRPPLVGQTRTPAPHWVMLNWTTKPTAGNPIDYPGTNRATYLEQNGSNPIVPPADAAGKVFTFSFDVQAWNISTPITIVPILWLSMAQMGWLSGQYKAVGAYVTGTSTAGVFCLYQCVTAHTTSGSAPNHTSGVVGNWQYIGACKGRQYELYESGPGAHAGNPYVAKGVPNAGAGIVIEPGYGNPRRVSVDIALPTLGSTNTVDYPDSRTLLPPEDNTAYGGLSAFVGAGFDLIALPVAGTCIGVTNIDVRDDGLNRFNGV